MEVLCEIEDAHDARILCLIYCQRTNEIITGAEDGDIKAWDANTGRYTRCIKHHQGWVTGLCFSTQYNFLFSCSVDTHICVWSHKGERKYTEQVGKPIHCMAIDNERSRLLVSHSKGELHVFNIVKPLRSAVEDQVGGVEKLLEHMVSVKEHTDFIRGISCSPLKYYSAGYDRTLVVYDTDDPRRVQRFHGVHDGAISVLARDDANSWVITGGYDKTVKVWLPDIGLLQEFPDFQDTVSGVCFVPETQMFWIATNGPCPAMVDPRTAIDVTHFAPPISTASTARLGALREGAKKPKSAADADHTNADGSFAHNYQVFHYFARLGAIVGVADYTNLIFWKHNPNTAEVFLRAHTDAVESIYVDRAHGKTLIYSGGADSKLVRWEPMRLNAKYFTHEEVSPGMHTASVTCITSDVHGKIVVAGCENGNLVFHTPVSVMKNDTDNNSKGSRNDNDESINSNINSSMMGINGNDVANHSSKKSGGGYGRKSKSDRGRRQNDENDNSGERTDTSARDGGTSKSKRGHHHHRPSGLSGKEKLMKRLNTIRNFASASVAIEADRRIKKKEKEKAKEQEVLHASDDEWENVFELDTTQRHITALHQLRKPKPKEDMTITFNLEETTSEEEEDEEDEEQGEEQGEGEGDEDGRGGKRRMEKGHRGTHSSNSISEKKDVRNLGGDFAAAHDDGNNDNFDADDKERRAQRKARRKQKKGRTKEEKMQKINDMVESAYADWKTTVVDFLYGMRSGHTQQVSGCAFVAPGILCSVSWDKSIRFWQTSPTIDLVAIIEDAHEEEILGLVYVPELNQIATCGADGVAKVWDIDTHKLVVVLAGHGDEGDAAAVKRGKGRSGRRPSLLAKAGRASRSPSTARAQLRESQAQKSESERNSSLSTSTSSSSSSSNGAKKGLLSIPEANRGGGGAGPSDNGYYGDTSSGGGIGAGRRRQKVRGEVSMLAWNPVHSMWVTGSEDKTIRSWATDGRCVSIVHSRGDGTTALCVDETNGWVIAANTDHKIRVYDALKSEVLRVFTGHTDFVASLVYIKDTHQFVSTSMDGQICVWPGHEEAPPTEVVDLSKRRGNLFDPTSFVPPEDREERDSGSGSDSDNDTKFVTYNNAPKLSKSTRMRGKVVPPKILTDVQAQVRGTLAPEMDFRPRSQQDPAEKDRERRTEKLNTLLEEVDNCIVKSDPEAGMRYKISSKRKTIRPSTRGMNFMLPK